jgi:hypothetical protein
MTLEKIMTSTDNLSFYHKVLLPCVAALMVATGGLQITMIRSMAEVQKDIKYLTDRQNGTYTATQATSDWRYQGMVDLEQNKRMDSFETQLKSHATQLYNIRSSQ